ncbi:MULTISPECIES: transcription-repair coupling factor [unclassified Bradyrhizobium]|uniref:transcription-repair coupling factor n=1 Tax=unclassified Bradyrhizobium TaxID=2631580 RepID=UPI001BA634C0|nr:MULTISPECIES: transcription-repair coupling factor [unclassified Bradyrhizobium]MBR1206795.1 transcription-repair coupling factor [Bradyrhizobium sp. AUGA SZCCT0124]MBR1316789.1 transcription-repair coupling factor [Bradyrhizobium sp. AUGA SZCCT0051]MBR1344839.1 transcription-repair coupling factor [Bradyrhizobium sp. AUGA SZCCT0105]MBR1356365.1 transcription-repair coupling factor [Bradyrhizobium sp. AUGA SZCCT0045]
MKQPMKSPAAMLAPGRVLTIANVAEGAEGLVISDLARAIAAQPKRSAVSLAVVCRDGARMQQLARALEFFAPDIAVMQVPAWDCQPYDRVSPHSGILAQRLTALAKLSRLVGSDKPLIVLTTVNAAVQRVPARDQVAAQALSVAPGNVVPMDSVVAWLEHNGYTRSSTVREPGEYAVRGGILDLFPAGLDQPVRFDFFGDSLESIRTFDAETQRTLLDMRGLDLVPVSEFQLTTETIRRFRMGYVAAFGAPGRDDQLYEAVSEGRRHPGMEHWLPLFQERMDTLFDYLDGATIAIEPQGEDAARERFTQIADYYDARREALEHPGSGAIYKPLPPDKLYLSEAEWARLLGEAPLARLTPFAVPEGSPDVFDAGARQGRNFAPERADGNVNVFEAVVGHIGALQSQRKKVIVALWSEGSRDRMGAMLRDHKLLNTTSVNTWRIVQATPRNETMLAVVGMESGFETDEFAVISEQDILGDRLVRPRKASRKLDNFISEVTSLATGDLVVHVEHGIGRFVGLQTLEVSGAPHDCLELHYAAETKLFLPVENIELLSRYGSDSANVELDRLGGGGWQARKAKLKNRIREIAGELIKIAAERQLHEAPKFPLQPHVYDEFCARFPYEETEDQLGAINSTLKDLEIGRPMDRLICGDVGFGKTEVALRAAFAVALEGRQVAVVVPTTLLARQHSRTFTERFRGFPVNVAQASRLVSTKELNQVKKGLTDGNVDIVVGTHALLGKAIKFKDLGLLIVDEEQHFGVSHKERLKQLRAQVHVLTLSATPIPRTLQLALTGVRELSIIASPPVDRLAVRTFVAPHDPLMIREALLRERYRGGQAFYVVPRIEDLAGVKDFLDKNVPEMKVAVAHGQMPPTVIEDIMSAFYDGKYDILLSTTIVESGLDIPNANTLIVHRADMFGLAQLYQLRGRVGRSKLRAYALFTLPAQQKITAQAERRLKVLQSLETLGAGFQLASHDLDIRGAGNLLGEEQSGHIKEVGFELYQSMLEEAIINLKAGVAEPAADRWSPQITIGMPVLIPEDYVNDLSVRLSLYRRLADLETDEEIDSFAAEMRDRFGVLPDEVRYLFKVAAIKAYCRRANVGKVDAGPKGAVIAFRDNSFAHPERLVMFIRQHGQAAKVRPDMKVVFFQDWETPEERLAGTTEILRQLANLAETKKAA